VQHSEYIGYAVLGVCLLLFLGVAAVVIIAVIAKSNSTKAAPKPPVATLYPIPPAERGSPQHTSLLDLFDRHKAEVVAEQARDELKKKLRDLIMDTPAPKA
jgi:flagellar basal body-associated protein FliL